MDSRDCGGGMFWDSWVPGSCAEMPSRGVLWDLADVCRSHIGSLSPTRRAPQVGLDVAGVCRLHIGSFSPTRRAPQVRFDVAGVCTLHIGSFSPTRRAPGIDVGEVMVHTVGVRRCLPGC